MSIGKLQDCGYTQKSKMAKPKKYDAAHGLSDLT